MTIKGVDYSSGYGPHLPGALVAGGYRFAMRYVSHPGNPKNLTAAELAALHAADLGVGIVFETTAGRALDGEAAGKEDADSAREQITALGLAEAAVYFAADFDASRDQTARVVEYIRGAALELGHDRTGVYGGIAVVDACVTTNACSLFWQTSAWSHGQVNPRAHLYQHVYGVRVLGAEVDVNDLRNPDAGLVWPRGSVPTRDVLHLGDNGADVRVMQTLLNKAGFGPLAPDGVFGRVTRAALRHAQAVLGVTVDGIYGPVTRAALTAHQPQHP